MLRFFRKKREFLPTFSWRDFSVLFAGLAIYVGLAWSTITKFSIWFDEAFGSYLIRFDFASLTRYTANDVHPPLYYWLLKIWASAFGNTELGLRSMSIFFGVVTIVLAFLFVLRYFGPRVAYVSLIFLVLSPMFVRYGQEARMYTLLTAIIVAATYVLVYAQQTKKLGAWVAYGVLVALGMLTQYFAALVWIAHWVWRYMTVRSHGEKFKKTIKKLFTKEWVIAHVVAIAVFLPWLPFFVAQVVNVQGNGFWVGPVTTVTLSDFLSTFLIFQSASEMSGWLAVGFYALLVVFVYMSVRVLKTLRDEERKSYLLVLCLIVAPVVMLVLLSMPPLQSVFVDRYLMSVVIFMPLFIALCLEKSREFLSTHVRLAAGVLVVALFAIGIYNQAQIGNYNKSSEQSNMTRQIVDAARSASPNVPIIANTVWLFYEAVVYDQSISKVYFVDENTRYEFGSLLMLKEDDTFKIKDIDTFTQTNKLFWVIGNIRGGGEVTPLREDWQAIKSVVVDDRKSGKPLLKATLFSAE